jgi:hypothetical protein
VTIVIALQMARQKKWAGLCGLALCSVGVLHDAFFEVALGVVTGVFLILHFLFLVVDIVAVIYLFKHRTWLRKA